MRQPPCGGGELCATSQVRRGFPGCESRSSRATTSSADRHRQAEEVWEGDRGLPPPSGAPISANAYIGARAIAEAITAGAQVVVTGRVADPSLALGPLVAHYGWDWNDLDRIAAGTLAGHLLECGAQITGGYFADPGFKDVPRPEAIGFPIAEVAEDGQLVITKPAAQAALSIRGLSKSNSCTKYTIPPPISLRT